MLTLSVSVCSDSSSRSTNTPYVQIVHVPVLEPVTLPVSVPVPAPLPVFDQLSVSHSTVLGTLLPVRKGRRPFVMCHPLIPLSIDWSLADGVITFSYIFLLRVLSLLPKSFRL